jgi:hypothetical protein
MAWYTRADGYLTCKAKQALLRSVAEVHEAPKGLSGRMEVLMAERRPDGSAMNVGGSAVAAERALSAATMQQPE